MELASKYDPQNVEAKWYEYWLNNKLFSSKPDGREPYTVVIPPPNVTGVLHMGHMLNNTIQDILVRHARMEGKNACWVPGTDHASIATEAKVVNKLAQEGINKADLTREEFLKHAWAWTDEHGGIILKQLRKLGCSCDWERTAFTMDEKRSKSVIKVFCDLYNKGLIYRGVRMVNWDPSAETALSDEEVVYKDEHSKLYNLKYYIAPEDQSKVERKHDDNVMHKDDKGYYAVVATTRPETIMGDTAMCINPDDVKNTWLKGLHVIVPLVGRCIPIIEDSYVDIQFGTGCLKVTPAHDINDHALGLKHGLETIDIFNDNGTLSEAAGLYVGQDRMEVRKQIAIDLKTADLMEKVEDYDNKVGYSERTNVPIEPKLSTQWFLSMQYFADIALDPVMSDEIEFYPKDYKNIYRHWLENIKDWCISRQLWWGHRIPAWYDAEGNVYVARNEEEVRSKYNLDSAVELKQDEDVLDTWFSSGLWTFSTLGWPEQTKELKMFHPTDVLITGFDIIFFWVARMIMFTMHFVKDENGKPQVPFKTVYVTGLIRDEQGQKMSKSKGNVLDPIDMIDGISLEDLLEKRTGNMMQPQLAEKIAKATRKEFAEGIAAHGTDALRFTLAALASNGRDINWDMKRLEGYRNFCNKLWNASRFVLTNEKLDLSEGEIEFSLADRWIQSEFNRTVETFRNSLSQYRFDLCANAIYEFTWNQFCDWYLELTKPVFANGNAAQIRAASQTLVHVLEKLLRLAHPLIPFITEEIWQKVKGFVGITADSIMLQPFPQVEENGFDPEAEAEIEWLKEVIVAVRNIRAESNIAPSKGLDLLFRNLSAENAKILEKQTALLKAMAKLDNVQVLAANETAPLAVAKLVGNAELLVPMAGFINKEAELARLTKEIEKYQNEVKRIENKLSNEAFVAKAPEAVIAKEREKQAEYQSGLEKIQEQYKAIEAL